MNAIAQGNLESEKKVVKDDMRAELKEGDKWFVIDSKWFAKWKLYVDFDGQFRGSRSLQVSNNLSYFDCVSNKSISSFAPLILLL